MINLISAGFNRLFKSKIFYLSIVVVIIYSFFSMRDLFKWAGNCDQALCFTFYLVPITACVLIPIFVGRDFSDKTIRNKVIVGHPRSIIYLAYFIVCLGAEAIIFVSNFIFVIIFSNIYYNLHKDDNFSEINEILINAGVIKDTAFLTPASEIVKVALIHFFTLAVCVSLFLFIVMVINSRTRSIIACVILIVAVSMFSQYVDSHLYSEEIRTAAMDYAYPESNEEPDYTRIYETPTDAERIERYKEFQNKMKMEQDYLEEHKGENLSKTKKAILVVLYDCSPVLQAVGRVEYSVMLLNVAPSNWISAIFYNLITVLCSTGLGILIFNKKELI